MTISTRGKQLIQAHEGLRLEAYQDSAGVWTIGYGTTAGVEQGQRISQFTAGRLFARDVKAFASCVAKTIKKPVSQRQFDAMVSLAYNIGCGAFERSSVAKRFNAGDENGAAQAFLMWNKITVNGQKTVSNGLDRRRREEMAEFIAGKNDVKRKASGRSYGKLIAATAIGLLAWRIT